MCAQLAFRGHSRAAYAAALSDLVDRGWLAEDGDGYLLTEAGLALREEAEATTDRYFYAPWTCLDAAEMEELRALLMRLRQSLAT